MRRASFGRHGSSSPRPQREGVAAAALRKVVEGDNQLLGPHSAPSRPAFQLPPAARRSHPRLRGSVYDVAVDLRRGSPTYGRWKGETLTAGGGEQLFVPRGFAHAFCTLEPEVIVAYKVDDFYAPASDSGLIWDDPTLAIDWPIASGEVVLSDKDLKLGRFADFVSPFRY